MSQFLKLSCKYLFNVITLTLVLLIPLQSWAEVKTKTVEGFKGKIARDYKNSKEVVAQRSETP